MNIYWYCPPSVMVSFKDPMDNPSFRLRCFLIHEMLLSDGFNSQIVDRVELINKPDIVVLMSFGEQEYIIAERVTQWGGAVIHDYCENIRGIPILERTKELCKYIVCCSSWLAREESITYGDKVKVVRDPIEVSPVLHNHSFKRDKLKVVWSGMSGNAEYVEKTLKPIIEKCGMEYVEISNRFEATYQWSSDWQSQMASCDIAVCPQSQWAYPAKSNVKVTAALSLALPVIASPLESYLEVIEHGYNGYIAHTLEDWENYLNEIKLIRPGEFYFNRSKHNLEKYDLKNIYSQWLEIFKQSVG